MVSEAASPPVTESGRDRIMDEAAALFLRNGYEGTSLRRVADVVGIKAGSIYYHFSSKDELLTAILERGIDVRLFREITLKPHDSVVILRVGGFRGDIERDDAFRASFNEHLDETSTDETHTTGDGASFRDGWERRRRRRRRLGFLLRRHRTRWSGGAD